MIKLKSTNNTQTFYIAKCCSDVCITDNTLPLGSYTKAEADERFQPKGDYLTPEDAEQYLNPLLDPIKNDIIELEGSKQEVFQVNQPLYFERSDEDLTLNVNLEDYATKEDLENIDVSGKQDLLVSGVNIKTINNESILGAGNISTTIPTLKYNASTNKFEGDFQSVYSAITSEDTPFSIYLPHNNEVIEATLAFVNGNNITAYASITYTGNSMHFAYYIRPDGTYTNAISQFQAQEELTPGDNIEIDDDLVISWVAPDVQFVNTIFTDDEMLKYAIADFKGGYTEKEFPLATTSSAGLMSPEDKAKLDAGASGESVPYIKVERNGTISDGDALAVFNALQAYKPATVLIQDSIYLVSYVLMESFYVASSTKIDIWAHSEFTEGTYHNTFKITLTKSGDNVTSSAVSRDNHTYVDKSAYDTKVSEIDTAISNLEAQIGDIATVLDNIQGEVI